MILHNGKPPLAFKSVRVPATPAAIAQRQAQRKAFEAKLARNASGPGSIFSSVIFKLTGQKTSSCGRCSNRMRTMNAWGWWGCWKNRKTILQWLSEEARRRGHQVSDLQCTDLFRAALKEAFAKR